MSMTAEHHKALLAKAAALVWRLEAAVASMKLHQARADIVDRIAFMAVAEALRD